MYKIKKRFVHTEKGCLEWNTALREAYPDLEMRSEYENITLIQMLSHRAGLPEWIYHVSSRNVREQFIYNWWKDRDTPANLRSDYLKDLRYQFFGLRVIFFNTEKGGLRKSKLLVLHQADTFLKSPFLIVNRAFRGLIRAL